MRKKSLNGKRVMALALAFSLVLGEAGTVVAAPAVGSSPETETVDLGAETVAAADDTEAAADMEADVQPAGEEAVETEAEECISGNDAQESVSANDTELDAEEKADGSLSKIIGLKVSSQSYDGTFTNEYGDVVIRYVYKKDASTAVEVPGEVKADTETGLYKANGRFYRYRDYDKALNVTTFYSSAEVALLSGTEASYLDQATKLYKINGKYYTGLYQKSIGGKDYIGYDVNSEPVVPAGSYADQNADAAFNRQYGRYVASDSYYQENGYDKYNSTPNYYEVGGKYYRNRGSKYVRENGKSVKKYYVYNEIMLNAEYPYFGWKALTKKEGLKNSAGQDIQVGYQVEINGAPLNNNYNAHDKAGNAYQIQKYSGYEYDKYLAGGQSVKIRVRGLYYHQENKVYTVNGTQYGDTVNIIDSFGEWSEPLTYTYAGRKNVSAVASVTAKYIPSETQIDGVGTSYTKNTIRVSFTPPAGSSSFYIYRIASKKALKLTAANFRDVYCEEDDALASLGISRSDISTTSTYTSSCPYEMKADAAYSYYYFAVEPNGVAEPDKYYNNQSLGTITTIAGVTAMQDRNTLQPVTGLRIEKSASDDPSYTTSTKLVWDGTDQKVVVFAYEAAAFPANYTAKFTKPSRTDANGKTRYMMDELSDADELALRKVKTLTATGSYNDSVTLSTSSFSFVPGRTYYFVAYAYADTRSGQTPVTYKTTVTQTTNGVEKKVPVTYSYDSYIPLSKASNVVSYKYTKLSKPTVHTFATKNSVKLTVSGFDTGYEVYRKSGKKFKKLATMTDDVYTDTGLKNGASYTYKVRSYYYNRDTKEKYYSDYKTVTVKTADAANISMHVKKASKTSAKISWTKVSGAVKYEIYRSSSENTDPKSVSKKFSAYGRKDCLSNDRYELIKTLGKSKTSLTDKKLTAGQKYHYIVVAYYKAGGKTEYVSGGESVVMGLDTYLHNVNGEVNGSRAKITWDKDTYASKYEVEYTVFDINNKAKTQKPVKVSTRKNAYTIGGLASGETVEVRVRAAAKGNVYGRWTAVYDWSSSFNSLAPVKGIKATAVAKKTADGKTVNGVKITWKAVKGAKYYKVYRSTYEGVYDKDKKLYKLPGGSYIKKEGNDDFETNSSSLRFSGSRSGSSYVSYKEYNGVYNSVTGTSAYDYEDVPAGVTYYYTVQAFGETPMAGTDSRVYSVMSSKAGKVTADGINALTLKNSKKGKVTVTFNTVPGAKKYTVYRSLKKGGKYTKVATVKVTKKNKNKKTLSYTGKAAKKKTYYYKVVAEGTNELNADMNIESVTAKIKVKK